MRHNIFCSTKDFLFSYLTNFKTRLQLRLLHLIEKSYMLLIIKNIKIWYFWPLSGFKKLILFINSTCYVSYHWILSKYILKVLQTPISNSIQLAYYFIHIYFPENWMQAAHMVHTLYWYISCLLKIKFIYLFIYLNQLTLHILPYSQ